jgi:hypothetical protein
MKRIAIMNGMNMRRPLAVLLLLTVGLYVGVYAVLPALWDALRWKYAYVEQITFESTDWKAPFWGRVGPPYVRQQMVDDLVTNVLPGKHKAEIEQILGVSPTKESVARSGSSYYDRLEWDLLYWIGTENCLLVGADGHFLSRDEETFVIRVDESGKFISWYIEGSRYWPRIVSRTARATYSATR